jgi:hypothetical protein
MNSLTKKINETYFNESNFKLFLVQEKNYDTNLGSYDVKYFFKMTDGRSSAKTDKLGIEQELRNLHLDSSVLSEFAKARSEGSNQITLSISPAILKMSGISFK